MSSSKKRKISSKRWKEKYEVIKKLESGCANKNVAAVAPLEVRTCEFEGVSTRSKRRMLLFTGITLFPRKQLSSPN